MYPEGRPAGPRALRIEAVLEQAGTPAGRVETIAVREPRRLQETLELAGIRQVATVRGDETWRRDANGDVREVTGDERASFLLSHDLLFHGYLEPDPSGLTVRAHRDGLELIPTGGLSRVLHLEDRDGETGPLLLPVSLTESQHGVEVRTTFEEWRLVDGVRFPFRSVQRSGDPRFDLVITTTVIESIAPPEEAEFRRPAPGTGTDARIVDPHQARSIPLEFLGAIPVVRVRVEGSEPRPFLVDTGAGATVLGRRLAEELGLTSRGVLEARGAGGSESASFVEVRSLRLPGVEITNQTLVTVSLDQVAAATSFPLDGVLGYDFLSRFAVEIDYAAERLRLFAPETYRAGPQLVRVPLSLEANVPRIEGRIDDLPAGKFLLDTGNNATLLIHSPFARHHGLKADAEDGALEIAGIGGSESLGSFEVGRLTLGSAVFRNVTALVSSSESGIVALEEAVGNVGSALFADGVLAFDYSEGAAWVPRSDEDSASPR